MALQFVRACVCVCMCVCVCVCVCKESSWKSMLRWVVINWRCSSKTVPTHFISVFRRRCWTDDCWTLHYNLLPKWRFVFGRYGLRLWTKGFGAEVRGWCGSNRKSRSSFMTFVVGELLSNEPQTPRYVLSSMNKQQVVTVTVAVASPGRIVAINHRAGPGT